MNLTRCHFIHFSERQSVKVQLYNFNDLTADREWLYDVLLSDTDTETEVSDEDDYIKDMLKTHLKQQKLRENFYKKPTVSIAEYIDNEITHLISHPYSKITHRILNMPIMELVCCPIMICFLNTSNP